VILMVSQLNTRLLSSIELLVGGLSMPVVADLPEDVFGDLASTL